jgi:hypothetical protein
MSDAPQPVAPVATDAVPPAPDAAAPVAPTVEAAPQQSAKEKADAERWAALTKRETALQKQREALKTQEGEVAALRKQVEEHKAALARAKSDPLGTLKSLGLSYEDLTAAVLNDGKPAPSLEIASVREEIAAMKREREEAQRAAAEAEKALLQQEQAAVLDSFKAETRSFIDAHGDDYELIRLHGAHEAVVDFIAKQFAQSVKDGQPRILSQKEAADAIEARLVEQAEKIAATKKLQQRLAAQKQPSDKQSGSPAQRRSVSNDLSASTAPVSPALTEAERIKRALAALDGV